MTGRNTVGRVCLLLLASTCVPDAAGTGTAIAGENQEPAVSAAAAFQPLSENDAARVAALVGKLGDRKWGEREAASAELAKIGEGAIPALFAAVDGSDLEVAERATELLDQLVPASRAYKLLRSRNAVEALGGPEKALPVLRGCLELPAAADRFELQWRAVAALAACGKPAVPVLAQCLSGDSAKEAEMAAVALAAMGPDAAAALPALVEALGADSPTLRQNSARALGALGAAAAEVVPALEKATKEDSVSAVCVEAAQALWRLRGRDATEAVLAGLTKGLEDRSSRVRFPALAALAEMGPDAVGAVPALVNLVGDPKVGERALAVLGGLGPAAKDALPAVEAKLEDNNPAIKLQAALAQLRITGHEDEALKVLVEALGSEDARVADLAIRLLGDMGPPAAEAAPALEKLLENQQLRRQVSRALEKIRAKTDEPK